MDIQKLSIQNKRELTDDIKRFFSEEYDEEISDFKVERILDFFVQAVGDRIYEQAIEDAHYFMTKKLEEIFTLQSRSPYK